MHNVMPVFIPTAYVLHQCVFDIINLCGKSSILSVCKFE